MKNSEPKSESLKRAVKMLRDEADLCRNETATDVAEMMDSVAATIEPCIEDAEILDWLDGDGKNIRVGYEWGYWYSSIPGDGESGCRQAKTFRELILQRLRPNDQAHPTAAGGTGGAQKG